MRTRIQKDGNELETLDTVIEEITVDAYGDHEQLQAFRQAFVDELALPVDGFVIGEPVSVISIDYDGNERRGLTAKCRRDDGSEHLVALSEVVLPQTSSGYLFIAAYRRWLNLDPYRLETGKTARPLRQHKAADGDVDLGKPVEMVAFSVKDKAVRCRLLENNRIITVRVDRTWEIAPGAILTVMPRKQWRFGGHPYLSGELQATRIDVKALGLVPLGLEKVGMWDPREEYWGEEDEPIEEWAKPIIAHGPRPKFEMEMVLPGEDTDDPFEDPITRSNDLNDAGEWAEARKLLMELCEADLRCLDAHVHLGNLVFDDRPQDAIQHYEIGLRIGELSLGDGFADVLPWGRIRNRAFLRCMHNYGLCLWRLGRFDEAALNFQRMLWLNPTDNQGARFLIGEVMARRAWEDSKIH